MRNISTGWPTYGLVYYYQPSCAACYSAKPVLEWIAANHPQIDVVECDITLPENQGTAKQLRVSMTPSISVVKNGQEVHRFVGATSAQEILNKLQ
jgi:thioredoxin-like negative regulator of GroEL